MDISLSDILPALVAYAGPLDDPRVGWLGIRPSHPGLFQCERCGKENIDSSKIDHTDNCSAKLLLNTLAKVREYNETHI